MPLSLAIIADDLTGALDSAAPFAARGLKVAVALAPRHVAAALATGPDILAVTTDSREIPPEAARLATAEVIAALPPVRIFKKVDSRLKGNIEAELSALDFEAGLAAPAIPEFGRIVQGGAVTGFGVDRPIMVADCLGRHAARVEIPDVTTTGEMRAVLERAGNALLIGARGLAEALAAQMSATAPRMIESLPGRHGLFVLGSRDPITLAQVELLRDMPGVLWRGAENGRLSAALPEARRLVLQALPGTSPASSEEVSAALAEAVAPLLQPGFGTALLSGGATAIACLRARGAEVLKVRGECLPGLVVADWQGVTVITKSGGFGDPACLTKLSAMIEDKAL
ncbi:four-carbon acid sugar kinase family protein [Paracoccus ravus]|uniref:four-carbon acid sugar kinase family protein n=1 Tax=Paracoccus ravus TaxID=2447760 RepID=UPI00106DF84E|nr:four-carbon acid sugar kinase family protein [Paracoccus ravus]